MRDLDRVKDKIEIRLEPRQVVMLALATMAFSGGLFAAGYVVGTRRAAPPPAATAPDLAAIDAAARAPRAEAASSGPPAALGEVQFLFPSVLTASAREAVEPPPVRVPPAIVRSAPARPPASAAARRPATAPAPPPEEGADTPAVRVADAPETERAAARVDDEPEVEVAAAPPRVEAPVEARVPAPEDGPEPEDPPAEADEEPAASDEDAPAKAEAEAPRPRYTLQVKAVREKAEADAFVAELRRAGFDPHVILADVPGKGRWYRIRVGKFADMDEARAFQRKYKVRSGQPEAGFITDL